VKFEPARFSFFTRWSLGAPVEHVFEVLSPDDQPEGRWRGISPKVLQKGDRRGEGRVVCVEFGSPLGIRFRCEVRIVRRRPPSLFELATTGDLEGEGIFRLSPQGARTLVSFDWNARPARGWMNRDLPLLRPLLRWNHDRVMDRYAADLARRAGADLEILA
jgi:hypothetical protein